MIVNCFEKKVEVVLGYAASLVHILANQLPVHAHSRGSSSTSIILHLFSSDIWTRTYVAATCGAEPCSHRSVLRATGSYCCVICWTVGGWLISVSRVTDEC